MSIRVVNVKGLRGEDRKTVCYVGRKFAGWPASEWGNPFKVKSFGIGAASVNAQTRWRNAEISRVLSEFVAYADRQPAEWLARLWEACDHGNKPLGCWCVTATHGSGQAVVCHAQVLAGMLHDRYCTH